MAQLNVERKKNKNWWIWVLVVIAIFLLWWFFMRNDNQMETRLTPTPDTTIDTNNRETPVTDTLGQNRQY